MIKLSRLFLTMLFVFGLAVSASFAQEEIEIGDSVEGEADDEVVEYIFEMEEGQTVEINVESDDFDTYLILLDEDGDEVARNDDGGEGLNSRIVYTAEEDGEYTIEVGAFPSGSDADGDFELELEEIEVEVLDSTEMEIGEEIEIDVEDALSAVVTFEGSEGDVVTILVRSDADQDLTLVLENEDGDEVAIYDSFGSPALNRVELPDDGEYTLTITEWDEELLDDEIEVEIFESEILDLNDGPQALTLSEDVQVDYMVFEAEEDIVYAIFVSFDETPDSTVYINLLEEDEFFASTRASASGIDEMGMMFEVSDDGLMTIEFEYFGFGGEEIEVTVEIDVIE